MNKLAALQIGVLATSSVHAEPLTMNDPNAAAHELVKTTDSLHCGMPPARAFK